MGTTTSHRRPRHANLVIIAALSSVLAFAGGCATTGVNQGQINLVGIDDEWKMGQDLEAQLSHQLRLVNDGPSLAYVNQIGQRIARTTELADRPWKFHIVADPAINAFSTPGGQVYVNTGLILAAKNASQLSGVLAHEIGHGVARHATERLTDTYGLNIGAGLLLGQNPSTIKQIAAQIAASGLVAHYSRSDEREADRLGVQFMYNAGYDPNGMVTMFETLLATRKSRPSAVEQFFSSHPLEEERIASVRQEIGTLPRRQGLIAHDAGLSGVQQRVRRYSS